MSNPARNYKSVVCLFQTIALFFGIGALVAFAALLGGIPLASISGAIIGLAIGRIAESRFVTVSAVICGIVSGAVTTLAVHAIEAPLAGVAVGAVVFGVVGYVIWFLGATWFEHHRSA